MKALVTGGGGFIGGAVIRDLLARGDEVRSFSRGSYPALEALGVEARQGDLSDESAVSRACEGRDVVFHVGAKAGLWGSCQDYYRPNVEGTKNILAACRRHGVGRLVFTSSPSVVFDGADAEGIDESAPYPDHFDSHYSRTKALAEEMVLSANDSALRTTALRPHLVWGPGDNHIVPRLVARGRAGLLRRIGSHDKQVDTTYIENAAHAHILASDVLAKSSSKAAGRAYFISQGDPRPLWEIINGILAAAGIPAAKKSIPAFMALALAGAAEGVYRLLGIRSEPRLTRFLVKQLSTAHWFDLSAARRDLGYIPRVSIEEGFGKLKEWFAAGQPRV